MSTQIKAGIPARDILRYVPEAYHGKIKLLDFKKEKITLLLFQLDQHEVTTSRVVSKALKKLKLIEQQQVIALGGTFTKEAIDILKQAQVTIISIFDVLWTDETYIKRGLKTTKS